MTSTTDWAGWEERFERFLTGHAPTHDAAHDLEHIRRVVSTARMLAVAEQADLAIVIPAAWLHDCVIVAKDSPQRPQASGLAAQAAVDFLRTNGYPEEYLAAIHHAIEAHSFSANITPRTREAQIVQDADRLDALGAIGVARCLMLGGAIGRRLYDPHEPFPVARRPDDALNTIDHFYLKLLRLAGTMTTPAGQAEAQRRTIFMRQFLEQLRSEIMPSPGKQGETRIMSTKKETTLRLNMPQWQGGGLHDYYFGSQLLAWLAPPANGPVETVPVPEPKPGETLEVENGILARAALLQQARAARQAIEKHRPDRIVTLGGDCLIDLAPMAYLNTRYAGNLGVLWVDAHPDVLTPKDSAHGHTHVLSALLGRGDADLLGEVDTPVQPSHVMYAGLDAWTPIEDEVLNELGLRRAGSDVLVNSSAPVLSWLASNDIRHLAVHFDIDVLDPKTFGAVLFNDPDAPADAWADVPRGRLAPEQVVGLLHDVAAACDIVGLAIAEYMPWEAIATRNLLRKLPLLAD